MVSEQQLKEQLEKFDSFVEGYRAAMLWALNAAAEKPVDPASPN